MVVSQQYDRPGTDLFYSLGGDPEITEQTTARHSSDGTGSRRHGKPSQDRKRGSRDVTGPPLKHPVDAFAGIVGRETLWPHASPPRRKWIEDPSPADGGDGAVAPEHE